jgi:Purple acid Phosphatase, N-terminal domain/Calcineurin-like phosphoesterase/Secretion system C-terminal sorting domain/PKD domain
MRKVFIFIILMIAVLIYSQDRLERNLVGHWTFDDPDNLTGSSTGNDLILQGSQIATDGPEAGDGAVNIGPGSYYECYHNIPANGGSTSRVNVFTIVIDVKIPQIDQWYCFHQTDHTNTNDGDWFINPNGTVGVGETGYSADTITPEEWYRLAISVNLGEHYDYYLDGQLLQNGGTQSLDGRFSLSPAEADNLVLFFADNNAEDNAFDIANIYLYDTDLSAQEISDLGGYGHIIEDIGNIYMTAYLESPTPNSIYVSWHENSSMESIVEYGITETLGQFQTGDHMQFSDGRIWHTVQLIGLTPDTKYYYKCVSDTANSEIKSFRTQADDSSGHIRFAVYGDNRTDIEMHTEIINALKETVEDVYEQDLEDYLNVVLNVGDIVSNGLNLPEYHNEYFDPVASVSGNVPFMISIGNHENESQLFYDYMKYEDFQGDEGEKYYSFPIGSILFIALNSNIQGDTQLNWLQEELDSALLDDSVSWIFTFLHHPGRSEIWPDGNTGWVQNSVIPMLALNDKAEAMFYGHSHNYERGVWDNGNLRLLLAGGGGSALDRWGMYANQTDYHEIHRAHDYYGYSIFDVDLDNNSYTAESYSLGHTDLPMNNVVFDSFTRYRDMEAPATPIALSPANVSSDVLVASPFTSQAAILSSHFQLTDDENNWQNSITDEIRHWENIYGDTGAPDYLPVDLNNGIDLSRLYVDSMIAGTTYWWRVCYRDQNLHWSQWSDPAQFTFGDIINNADFSADIAEGFAPLQVRFTDISTGEVTLREWDFDGDGEIDSNLTDPSYVYQSEGVYSVTLTVTIAGEQFTETKENYITVTETGITDIEVETAVVNLRNYPNPFNPVTTISFSLTTSETAEISINIFNLKGQKITELPVAYQQNTADWNAEAFPSGIYFYKLIVNGTAIASGKLLLLK